MLPRTQNSLLLHTKTIKFNENIVKIKMNNEKQLRIVNCLPPKFVLQNKNRL